MNLTTISFPVLNIISTKIGSGAYGTFAGGCKKLESVSFGGITASTFASKTDQFTNLFNADVGSTATSGCTVHFPSNFDPDSPDKTFDITTLSGYPIFGGNASYIHLAYDLPATE